MLTAVLAVTIFALALPAQQPSDASTTKPRSAATLGNEKQPKKDKNPTSRTVTGQVTDETGQVLEGAMVTLTDKKTNERTSFFTKKDGRYRFEELSFNNDYEVQARYKNFASEPRKLSQFDAAPRPVRILEIKTNLTQPETASKN